MPPEYGVCIFLVPLPVGAREYRLYFAGIVRDRLAGADR